MKLKKVLIWTGGIVVALVLVVWLGGWGLLKSPFARQKAAEELTKILGVPVEVDSLDVGGSGTSASLRIPDADAKDNLVKIGGLETDITLGALLSGKVDPTYVTASDVDFLLRLNEKGEIVSPLPKGNGQPAEANRKPLPAVKINGGKVRIRQAGKDEFALQGLSAELKREGDGYVLTGNVDDPKWGKWSLSGNLSADFSDGKVALTTAEAQLQDPLLRTIPYVPKEVWDNLHASGPAAAAVTFTFQPGKDLSYAVDVTPKKASLGIPAIKATLTDVEGKILVADGRVTVTGGTVKLADGTGTIVRGEYLFYEKGKVNSAPGEPMGLITLEGNAAGLDITKLPKEWGVMKNPLLVGGKLKGEANLEMRISADGKLQTFKGGTAEVVDPKLSLKTGTAEIKFKLQGNETGGYEFTDNQ